EVDAIVIDEAHHFRNLSSQRYEKLYEICEGKLLYMLTATPVNNSFFDLLHMMELFTRREAGYFGRGSLGIHSLRGHFRRMETALETLVGDDKQIDLDQQAAEAVLARDDLFRELVIQRSRAYVKESLRQYGDGNVSFPQRRDPQVVPYSLLRTYRGLLDRLEDAFFQPKGRGPLLSLPIYFPLAYYRGDDASIDPMEQGRQRQVVGLIRTLLLKRFESSAVAFEASCKSLLLKLLYFIRLHNEQTARHWIDLHASLIDRIKVQDQRRDGSGEEDEDAEEDIIPEEAKKRIERLDPKEYNVDEMIMESLDDLDTLAGFLDELRDFDPGRDHKLQQLIQLLQTDTTLRQHKVLIFTEYRDTAHYLREQLEAAGVGPLDEVDSLTRRSRSDIIRAFSPYYNGSSSAALVEAGHLETRVLVSTDVLSEGLNLQDATCIISYDLHWNPVRLMQRIGRVDRRLDPALEAQMIRDHPEVAEVRGTVSLWNFLPPGELNRILSLYERVTNKTLRISKIFGIEGKKLLTPDDDYEALKTFSQSFAGTPSQLEQMRLAYQALQRDYPELVAAAESMPLRLFSGKQLDRHPSNDASGVFFCYQLPARDVSTEEWSNEAGIARWYLYWFDTDEIIEDVARAFECIRSEPDTPRTTVAADIDLVAVRRKLDKHVTNSYLKKVQAPIGVKATLLAWMELV
ncbi:MAG: helicase, partial [Armatimonadetes bacterium]|nr:helicase [Armatimonadota bacterium]